MTYCWSFSDPKLVKYPVPGFTITRLRRPRYFTKYLPLLSMHARLVSRSKKIMPVGQDTLEWKKILLRRKRRHKKLFRRK